MEYYLWQLYLIDRDANRRRAEMAGEVAEAERLETAHVAAEDKACSFCVGSSLASFPTKLRVVCHVHDVILPQGMAGSCRCFPGNAASKQVETAQTGCIRRSRQSAQSRRAL